MSIGNFLQYSDKSARHMLTAGSNQFYCWDANQLHHWPRVEIDSWRTSPAGWWGRLNRLKRVYDFAKRNKDAHKWSPVTHWSYQHCYTLGRFQWKRWWMALGEYQFIAKLPSKLRLYITYILSLWLPPKIRGISRFTSISWGFIAGKMSTPTVLIPSN